MDIILLQDVEKVGDKHEVVNVKNGFGRNFLIPKGLGIIANTTNMARLNEMRAREDAQEMKRLDEYQQVADKLKGQTLKIGAKAGTSGKIFGSVTAIQVSNSLQEQFGVDVDRRKIELPEDVKELGTYTLILNLHKQVRPEITFEVFGE